MRDLLRSGLVRVGLNLVLFGSGPLVLVLLAARLGLTSDPNPNPVGFGVLAMLTFWPGVLCILVGVVLQRTRSRR